MTYLDAAIAASKAGERRRTAGADVLVVLGTAVVGLVTWAAWTQLGGVSLSAETGGGTREVGAPSVTVAALLAATAGVLLARMLLSWLPRGLRWWTVIACAVWLLSFLGVLGAVSAAVGLGLASLHLVVGACVVAGVRRVHRDDPGPVAADAGRSAD